MQKECLYLSVHPENPQDRLLVQAVEILEKGGVIAYPTESGYALGCLLDNKEGADRIRAIRRLDDKHYFTLVCPDLSHLSAYAKVGNVQFRYLKSHLPGAYTFILPASREVPRRLQTPKRKYIGLRVTPNVVANALLSYFDKPLISVSLILPGEELPMTDGWSILETLGHALDAVVDGGFCGFEPTTVIDFTEDVPVLIRQGQGEFPKLKKGIGMFELTLMQKIAIWTLPVLMAITLHEAAHGWVASKLGDKTALMLGRVTLNPIKHIDPIGTILVPIVLLLLGGFVFGWAKAVPITPRNFKNPVRDMAWVAIAGPLSNLIMAIGWALIAKLGYMFSMDGHDSMGLGQFLIYSGLAGIAINLVLMVLNLIPIPPLDGSRVLTALLPNTLAYRFNQLEPYGLFILLGLLILGVLGPIISGPYQAIQGALLKMVGL